MVMVCLDKVDQIKILYEKQSIVIITKIHMFLNYLFFQKK